MRHNRHRENGDRSTVLMAEWIELNPRPNRRKAYLTITAELWLALALLVFLSVMMSAWSHTWEEKDWSDTGVGCTDDCLEPAIQDEAQTVQSQGRN